MLLAAGCRKEDSIVPVATNPFYGIYRPADRVDDAYLTVANDEMVLFAGLYADAHWLGHRLEALRYVPEEYLLFGMEGFVTDSFCYDAQGRIATIDSNVIFSYSERGLLESIRCIEPSYTKTLTFEYGDGEYPVALSDSTFWHNAAAVTPMWYSEVCDYRLEWMGGNLTICNDLTNGFVYTFDYDTAANPLCGLMWEEILRNLEPTALPTFLSRNNVTGYKQYTVHGLVYGEADYDCQYANNGRITVVQRKRDGANRNFKLSYLNY